jgi:hypothetical protein
MKKQILAPSILALFVASAAHAGATFDTPVGSLYLGGDVEFDMTSETDKNFDGAGRLLIDIHGERVLENGNFAAFAVAPTFKQYGAGNGTDDVYFQFGVKEDWNIKVGSFEATDLSSAGQDTYVAEAGTTAFYRASDARGRTGGNSQASQATFTKSMDASALEVTLQSQDDGDTVIARPVMTLSSGALSLAAGLEVPVVDHNDNQDWIGAGATADIAMSDSVTLKFRAAYKTGDDAAAADGTTDVDLITAGVGAQIENFYIAALYGDDEQTDETRIYASYKIPAVMDIDNFDVYLGAGYAMADDSDNDVMGAKVRLKYIF